MNQNVNSVAELATLNGDVADEPATISSDDLNSQSGSLFAQSEPSMQFASLAVRHGHQPGLEGEHSEAIYTSSSFVFRDAAEAAARFQQQTPGNVYSRFTNPTVRVFEQRLAALEGGEACIATASGMAAIQACCIALLEAGDHIVASAELFGSSVQLFKKYLPRMGNQVDFARVDDLQDWRAKIRPQTRMLFVETPSNPLTRLADLSALADLAHSNGAILVVDNCFCTPALQRPLQLGADLVIHSATKYLDGQGRCVGGAIVGGSKWIDEDLLAFLRTCGPTMSPFNAWVFLKGLETLELRMQRHCDSASQLANWLHRQPAVNRVFYPGLESHPQHQLCKQQQSAPGGIVSFEVCGDRAAAWQVINATRLLSITANLGDAKSTITHPATTTHGRLTAQQRARAGVTESLIRVSIGLESPVDIQRDLQTGLNCISAA